MHPFVYAMAGLMLAGYIIVILWLLAAIARKALVRYLIAKLLPIANSRPPDLVIGADSPGGAYLVRWELWRPWGHQVALHKIMRSDDDRAEHDHVSWHGSFILIAGYLEHIKGKILMRKPGAFIFRKALTPHRLELPVVNGGTNYAWTIWIRGPKWREWGFHCKSGWVHWEEFGQKGCD